MTRYSLANKGVILFFYLIIVLMGLRSVEKIAKQEGPEFPTWNAVVITRLPGAAPLKVEELVTERVEEKMKEVAELQEIRSVSQPGVSYVFLEIREGIEDVKPVWDKVRQKLDDLDGEMPAGATQPWLNNDFGKTKSFVIAVTGEGQSNRELHEVAKDLKKDLGQMKWVSRVDIVGDIGERVNVEFSNAKLSELGITADQIAQTLYQQNILAPGGEIQVGPQSIRLEPTGEYRTVEDVAKTVIAIPGQNSVFFLRDVARITRAYVDPAGFQMRYMGRDAVGVVVEMQNGGQILEMGRNINELLAETQKQLELGVDLHVVNYEPKWVAKKIDEFLSNLWQAIAMVVVFMVVLLGWREGLIIGALIPFSFLITLNAMELAGIPIHQISLMALIISLGMLVDNGIVMTESISAYVRNGSSKYDAALRSAKELFVPLLTSTATTVAAFMPIALAESGVGIYCRTITYGVGIVLLSSFFVTMTLIPILCTGFLKPKAAPTQARAAGAYARLYVATMNLALRAPAVTVALAVVLLVAVVSTVGPHIRKVFFPPNDRTQILVDFYMPEGTDYRHTRDQALLAERHILETYGDHILNMAMYIGEGGPRFQYAVTVEQRAGNYAQIMINAPDDEWTDRIIMELGAHFRANFPDAIAITRRLETGPPVGAPIQVRVYGKELDLLYDRAQKVEALLAGAAGTRGVRDDWGDPIPKLSLVVNQEQARRAGVSSASIAQTMRRVLVGESVTELREGDTGVPIVGRSREEDRTTLAKLTGINLPNSQGHPVPLTQVANVGLVWEAGKIRHLNRRRTITVMAYLDGSRTAGEIMRELKPQIEALGFPHGYGVEYGGEEEGSKTAEESINAQLPISMAVLVMILVAQFANVRKMLIILVTIPLSFIGVVLALYLSDQAFGFMAFIGVISLAGIVVNNAILLIEKIDADLMDGVEPIEAIVSAGLRRAFPIILTTLTTMCGLAPLALSGEFWGPMAVSIMGGLLVSTMLTLVVIPTLYKMMFRVPYKPYKLPA